MSFTARFGGAVILALVFAIGFYLLVDGLALAIVVGLCAAATWLVLDTLHNRRRSTRQ